MYLNELWFPISPLLLLPLHPVGMQNPTLRLDFFREKQGAIALQDKALPH